jgi:hypothetical protein
MEQLAGLTEEARKLALDRFRLLQPHLEDDRPLKAVAASAGIPFRTAQRWAALYQQFGLAGLARKKRTDDGQHRERPSSRKWSKVLLCGNRPFQLLQFAVRFDGWRRIWVRSRRAIGL